MRTIKATKKDGKLVIEADQQLLMDLFMKHVVDGSKLLITYEIETDDHSYAQISKVHASIRELATFTGEDFSAMKLALKQELALFKPGSNELKSFSDYSKVELSEAIRVIIAWGDVAGINLS